MEESMIFKNKILSNMLEIREKNNMSQKEMSLKLGHSSSAYYNMIETGKRGLDIEVLFQIATIFKMSVTDLITYPDTLGKVEVCENCLKKDKIIDNLNKYIELLQQNGTK
jgi:transcriptional regulator with XRE-family HTH domain